MPELLMDRFRERRIPKMREPKCSESQSPPEKSLDKVALLDPAALVHVQPLGHGLGVGEVSSSLFGCGFGFAIGVWGLSDLGLRYGT